MMWEIALLIVAVAFLLLVVFFIPTLLQIRDSAKELEFTLKEFRETLVKVNNAVDKADQSLEEGRKALRKIEKALETVDQTLGGSTLRFLAKPVSGLLEAMPVILSAGKIYRKYIRRR